MNWRVLLVQLLLVCETATPIVVHGEQLPKKVENPPPIREFDIETLSRLGREIYQHDQLAWVATDILLAKVAREKLEKEEPRGWIVDTSAPDAPIVRFLRAKGQELEAAYDIFFPKGRKPTLSTPQDRELTASQRARSRALQTAREALMNGTHPWCGGKPNTVVLDDPDGAGFLVYYLRAKPSMEEVPIGGHYRITISADGLKAEQIDQLFASCLTVPRRAGVPKASDVVALYVTNIVSQTPLETHVFLSLQEKLPFSVSTSNGKIWMVEKGRMAVVDRVKRD